MAEALARRFVSDKGIDLPKDFRISSAGLNKAASAVKPLALEVLTEVGVGCESLSTQELRNCPEAENHDALLLVLCDEESCRSCGTFLQDYPAKMVLRRPFPAPSKISKSINDAEQVKQVFRDVRDEITLWIEKDFLNLLGFEN
eukprot:CAMPEP_0204825118 /NCGR_PEP_ID=MMETSP1346-20131115/3065_1 /ASSEMBLY_ACC=CAM_ASM_000771 /TAXON_ID=215587 /ORGANISM="Aplanochytrium stocchinoi, Strain GSBS06" /LENGTH=143 /DNA_ID=CAMNT_0051952623 /DNA_START=124 /DNA_END=555 /DNA_ORIENTATION=+